MRASKSISSISTFVITLLLGLSFIGSNAEARRYRRPRFPTPIPMPAPAPAPAPAPTPAPAPATSQTQALTLATANLSALPGQSISFTTRFNAVPMDKNYVVFVHFVNSAGGAASFGADYFPTTPTMQWSGLVSSTRTVTVPSNLPVGLYTIRIGLYENVAPYLNRAILAVGSGVTEDGETRYIVGTLNVSSSTTPSPTPTPQPAPQPAPAPAPAPSPAPTYTLSILSPASGSTVRGSIQIKGTGPGFKNVEVLTNNGSLLARTTPDATGNFVATVDTTKLSNGSQALTIDAWDSPAGSTFTHSDEKILSLNVQNTTPQPAPAPTPAPSPAPQPAPAPAPAPQPSAQLRIMFIGNSLTGVANMPAEFQHLANSKGYSPYVEEYIAYGEGLDYQLGRQDIRNALATKKWDYVVLQEFSNRPLTDPETFRQSVHEFDQLIKQNGARTVLFENWSYQGESTTSQLNSIYADVADDVGAVVAPLAKAWNYVNTNSGINLYTDGKHPTPIASYMGACVFYKIFYGQSPVGLMHEGSNQDTPDVFGGPVPSQSFINLDSSDGSSNVNLVQKAAGMY